MPNQQKIAIEEKIEYVRAYLRGEITQGGIRKAAGVKVSSVQMWIKRYEVEGVDGGYTVNGNRVYSPENKTNAHGNFNSRKHSGGGSHMSKARSTPQEERLQIVQECLASDKTTAKWPRNTRSATNRYELGRCVT